MNCKPGDFAVVVRSDCKNHGRILTVIRLATSDEKFASGYAWNPDPMWVTDAMLASTYGGPDHFMWDSHLRPIRDSDGTDETLAYAGKPQPVEA